MVYLDASPVIYYVEQTPIWGAKAAARIAAFRSANEIIAVSDLTRMECLVGALKSGDKTIVSDFATFFAAVIVLAMPAPVFDRAANIRATHGFKPLDSLHLAVAVEHGCTRFISNDARLLGFPDIGVELL